MTPSWALALPRKPKQAGKAKRSGSAVVNFCSAADHLRNDGSKSFTASGQVLT